MRPHLSETADGAKPKADGYGPFDDYDIGSRNQKGSISTRFGSRAELQRCVAILRANGISTIYLVTHAWHMRRALIAFHHFGIKIIPAPVQLDRFPNFSWFYLMPQVYGWQVTYYAVHEWLGYVDYALR